MGKRGRDSAQFRANRSINISLSLSRGIYPFEQIVFSNCIIKFGCAIPSKYVHTSFCVPGAYARSSLARLLNTFHTFIEMNLWNRNIHNLLVDFIKYAMLSLIFFRFRSFSIGISSTEKMLTRWEKQFR